jgi:hypothetical protein
MVSRRRGWGAAGTDRAADDARLGDNAACRTDNAADRTDNAAGRTGGAADRTGSTAGRTGGAADGTCDGSGPAGGTSLKRDRSGAGPGVVAGRGPVSRGTATVRDKAATMVTLLVKTAFGNRRVR